MKKRWLIRSLFLLPLLCVVAVWVMSYFAGVQFLWRKTDRFREVGVVQGYCWVGGINDFPPAYGPFRLNVARGVTAGEWIAEPTTLGFYAGPEMLYLHSFEIIFPLWLPTLLLLALNWFVWRRTKPKEMGRAFPIEPTSAKGGPSA